MSKRKATTPKRDDLTARLLRLQADFENYRKRTQKEKEEFAFFLNSDLILKILPVLDNFQLALKHLPPGLTENEWVAGIWQIEKQLEAALKDEGAEKIPTVGHKFNHNLHEAIEAVSSKAPQDEIIEEVTTGYKLGDRVIRHARVKVSTGNKK